MGTGRRVTRGTCDLGNVRQGEYADVRQGNMGMGGRVTWGM